MLYSNGSYENDKCLTKLFLLFLKNFFEEFLVQKSQNL
jgi:hypothetical protein